MTPLSRSTLVVSAGRPPADPGNPVNTPIAASVTFHQGAVPNYLRQSGSDSLRSFEEALGQLEGGRALAFSSGMAAVAALWEGLPAGSTVVVPRMTYSGVSSLADMQEKLGRLTVRRVEISDTAAVLAALRQESAPALLWIETPTNPMVGVADVPVLAQAAHEVGAVVAVDSTWNSPLLLRPLEHGADVVMHSVTKYLSGHSDLLMGALVTAATPAGDQRWDELQVRRGLTGGIPGMLELFLALRGLRTLAVRLERAQANAGVLAQRLAAHPKVERVLYPGLPDDPGHELVARLHDGFGAMMSLLVVGDGAAAQQVCDRLELITNATSLGGVETLLERRAQYAVDAANGAPDNLLRLSVGIEDVEDLWADLNRALG